MEMPPDDEQNFIIIDIWWLNDWIIFYWFNIYFWVSTISTWICTEKNLNETLRETTDILWCKWATKFDLNESWNYLKMSQITKTVIQMNHKLIWGHKNLIKRRLQATTLENNCYEKHTTPSSYTTFSSFIPISTSARKESVLKHVWPLSKCLCWREKARKELLLE